MNFKTYIYVGIAVGVGLCGLWKIWELIGYIGYIEFSIYTLLFIGGIVFYKAWRFFS